MTRPYSYWQTEIELADRRARRRRQIRMVSWFVAMTVGAIAVAAIAWLALVGFLVIFS